MDFEKQYYEADSFWKEGMVNDESNRKRIINTANLIPTSVNTLADIGCGNGVFLNHLKIEKPNIDSIGIDRSERALSYVNAKKKIADINDLPFGESEFDCVTCLQVMEHLPTTIYKKSLEELCRISKKYVIISVPYNENLEEGYTKCPQCLTLFNSDLHFRKYLKSDIESLLTEFNFKCLRYETMGESENFLGHAKFLKTFYPNQLHKWNSPICPLCGFSETPIKSTPSPDKIVMKPRRSLVSYFTAIPKLFWPKVKKDYWIIALYEKN